MQNIVVWGIILSEIINPDIKMQIITKTLTINELQEIAANTFGALVKAVVDTERELIALDAELHSDLEALLLEDGSKQRNLWGINLYPQAKPDEFIEFDSVINIRPSQGNRSRSVEDDQIRRKITEIVAKIIKR
ncbi:MAG: DUF5674 family protein [Candidatus Omnitrophota bacterium]|nr:DUF5674 family protein [Candidatus Omnitrophota bacterium]